jgi:hypothetical protein
VKRLALALLLIAGMSACNSAPETPAAKPQPKPADFVTGRSAFQKMFIAARGWAPDVQPFELESEITSDSKGRDGKSDLWRASFASATTRKTKLFQWSGMTGPDAPSRGVSAGTEDTYNPSNSSTQVFNIEFIKIDSDAAYDVAQKHGGEKLLAKTPDTPVSYLLDWNPRTNLLIWHVIYGNSRDTAALVVDVNATTGEFMHVEK